MKKQPQSSSQQLDQDVALSLGVLDSVIGEFDDGFLSESDGHTIRASRAERTKGQFSPNGKIDRIFDDLAKEIYDYDEKVERLNNFKICSRDKVIGGREDDKNSGEIPAPGSLMVAKQLYLDNLDRVKEENVAVSKSDRHNVMRVKSPVDRVSPRPPVTRVKPQTATGRQVSNEEKAVISELKQQVAGKEGKFIKVPAGPQRCNNKRADNVRKLRSDKRGAGHAQSQSPVTGDYFHPRPTLSAESGRARPSQRNRNKASHALGQDSHRSKQSRSKSLDVVQAQHRQPGAERHRRRQPPGPDLGDLSEDEIFLREQRPQQRQSRSRHKVEDVRSAKVTQSNGWFVNNQHQTNPRLTGSGHQDKRLSMAWDELPPHLRHYLNESSSTNALLLNLPAYLDEQLRYEHQMNIEAQRDLLRKRGFPASHPLVAGEIPVHPELVGHLHFGRPNQTKVPLHHEDFVRFLPEMQREGMQSCFPKSLSDLHKMTEGRLAGGTGWVGSDSQARRGQRRSRSRSTEARQQRPRSMFNPVSGREREEKRPSWQVRTDSGIGEELWKPAKHGQKTSNNKSSFGMILKDRFQKNPNMYFPDTSVESSCQISPSVTTKTGTEEDWSDSDTLVHNMSEGSFDKDSGLSAGQSSNSQSTGDNDMESLVSGARTRSITTPIKPVQTAVVLHSNPSVILDKKTLRNYTPRESSCLLRQFEEERLYSGRDKSSGMTASPSTQFSSLTSRKRSGRSSSDTASATENIDTCRSQMSAWSFASSAASFDWHAGTEETVQDDTNGPRPYEVQQVGESKEIEEESGDELNNLRKLLKEGRIAGLNDKPPTFTPPSPPANKKQKASPEKRPAPPPPPAGDELKPPPPSSSVQFLGGRRVHSVENICADSRHVSSDPSISKERKGSKQADNLKRSTSMQGQNPSKEYLGKSHQSKDSSLAQLIADSTEKKFRFNSLFKGIWKKKQYTFDS